MHVAYFVARWERSDNLHNLKPKTYIMTARKGSIHFVRCRHLFCFVLSFLRIDSGQLLFFCSDNNECSTNSHVCHQDAHCVNTAGSHLCFCNLGYSENGSHCININECKANLHDCHPMADCQDNPGTFLCQCRSGFVGNGRSCVPESKKCQPNGFGCEVFQEPADSSVGGRFECLFL